MSTGMRLSVPPVVILVGLLALTAVAPASARAAEPVSSRAVADPSADLPSSTVPPADDPAADGDAPAPKPLDPDEIADQPEPDPADGAVDDQVHEVIVGDSSTAQARLGELEADLLAAQVTVAEVKKRLAALATFEADLTIRRQRTTAALARAQLHRMGRTIGAYVRGGPAGLDAMFSAPANGPAAEAELLTSAIEADDRQVTDLLARRLELTGRLSRVAEDRAASVVRLRRARALVAERKSALTSGEYAARIFAAGGEIAITGFVFPVGDPHDFIDSWGFPRAGGRSHEGTDIFAPRGTPLHAVEDGVLARVGNDRLGGTKLWLVGQSGTHYYYAHLQRYALGVADGVTVEAGDVVGYVGDSGDARGTPPHLHFQLHPSGGDPVNPYPLLQVVDELDADRRAR